MAIILLVCFVTVLFFELSYQPSTLSCLLYSIVCFLPTILFLHRNYMCISLFSVSQLTTSTIYYKLLFNTCLSVLKSDEFQVRNRETHACVHSSLPILSFFRHSP
ncbi:hypothetical protein Smp_001520 [Schistosoma mansoni]|uniref:hypothetical protein n=1 Tax=Schistosoma mansoni TaxID=6183 RepID=UPI0001A633CF|nr:hypothetical protein Smp_001520 [Schistosoma mansoni]|eukprot:XP_018650205.1 hypothetical protein Smp_001520 [Schistosoma mansoni]